MSETAVVTGATGGIGGAVVRALASDGYRVYAVGCAPGQLAAMQNGDVVACAAALSRRDSLTDAMREEERVHGLGVTTIYPGGVRTELLRKVRERLGVPYDAAVTVKPETLAGLVVAVLRFPDDAEIMDVSLRAALPHAD